MRIAVVGHSLVADRQAMFFDYMDSLPNIEVFQIYPITWGREHRDGGFPIWGETIRDFTFESGVWKSKLLEFDPDILYVQGEFWQEMTHQMMALSDWGFNIAVFVWENLRPYEKIELEFMKRASGIVCGNQTAEKMIKRGGFKKPTIVMPQVGIDYDLFKPMPEIEKVADVIFLGRPVPEKGIRVLEKALNGTNISLITTKNLKWCKWSETPKRYNRARVHVSIPIETPQWREQWLSYAHAEALGCGLFCVGSDTPEILEQSRGCPGFYTARQKNVTDTRSRVQWALEQSAGVGRINEKGRQWAIERFGKEVIARQLINLLGSI